MIRKLENNELLSESYANDYINCLNISKKNDEIIRHLDTKMSKCTDELIGNLLEQSLKILEKVKQKNFHTEMSDLKIMFDNLLAIKNLSLKYGDEGVCN